MKRIHFLVAGAILASLIAQSPSGAQTYTFTGAVDNDFYNVGNWDDGLGGMPASLTSPISLDLVIDGASVSAASAFSFASGGALSLTNSSTLDVGSGNVVFGTGSSLNVLDSTLNLTVDASQLQLNSGSTTSLDGALLNVGDDLFFRSTVSILDSEIYSRLDDIEFQSAANVTALSGSYFETLDLAQIVSFASSVSFSTSTFVSGRFSIQTDVDVVAVDSDIQLNGDIDDAFNDITFGTLTLEGTTTLRADQLDEGITLFLKDSTSASFIDDDQEGEWLTASTEATGSRPSTVVFLSKDATLSFVGPQDLTDDATQIINGLSGIPVSYASHPQYFSPSDWDGQSDVTIRLTVVPEPSALVLLLALAGGLVVSRR